MKNFHESLDNNKYFKLIMGAGNKSADEIKKLSAVYSIAKADMFDIAPDEGVINAVKEGILSQGLNLEDFNICISYSIGEDKHGSKAFVNYNKCQRCQKCVHLCPYGAISYQGKILIDYDKCLGCQKCKCRAIEYKSQKIDIIESFSNMVRLGAKSIELHISTKDKDLIISEFKNIKNKFPSIQMGVCISREKFSDTELVEILQKLVTINGSQKLIVQADGLAMNGGKDTYYSTLQAVSIAQILKDLKSYKIISGGTNDKTRQLANLCKVDINGISIGSYGRLLIKEEVNNPEFWYNKNVLNSAISKAKKLIESVKNNERNN